MLIKKDAFEKKNEIEGFSATYLQEEKIQRVLKTSKTTILLLRSKDNLV